MVTIDAFREQLNRLIDRLGHSQQEIADIAGVTQQSVSRWKSGASTPPLDRVFELSPVLDRLESESRKRWEEPADAERLLASFLSQADLGQRIELLPLSPKRLVWNPEYQNLRDELVAKVPLLRVSVPLGHGITSLARSAAAGMSEQFSDVINVRVSFERITAHVLGVDEAEVYRSALAAAYHTGSNVRPELATLPELTALTDAVDQVIAQDVARALERPGWRNTLGRARHERVAGMVAANPERWRDALAVAESDAQVAIILDLSPSPAGRKYNGAKDELRPEYDSHVEALVRAVSDAARDIPRTSFIVIAVEGTDVDLTSLEAARGSSAWDSLESPPRLQRADFWDIVAAQTRTRRRDLIAQISPRLAVDLNSRGISSAGFELNQRLERALSRNTDHAGVVGEKDISAADSVVQMRLYNLERRIEDLTKQQEEILALLSDLRGHFPVGA